MDHFFSWCERCNEIANIAIRKEVHGKILARSIIPWWKDEVYLPNIFQCAECRSWWERKSGPTLIFYKRPDGTYYLPALDWFGPQYYVPITCKQRLCLAHAKHRFPDGKRKFRCDKHSGVCIVA